MILRAAAKDSEGDLSSHCCPKEGCCQLSVGSPGKRSKLSCDFFSGTVENERGLQVRCEFDMKIIR